MTYKMKRLLLLIAILAIFQTITAGNKDENKLQPKLVVGIVIDQMRYDYLYRFYDQYSENGFKRLMNEANEDKLTTNRDHQNREFKVIKEDVETVYLNENEIKALYEMQIDQPAYRTIRDIFVLNCYTGLRHSDWSKVSIENIHEGKLYVRTQKTICLIYYSYPT